MGKIMSNFIQNIQQMNWYSKLDVTEKILSIIAATITVLAVIFTWGAYNFGKNASLNDVYAIKEVIDKEGMAVIQKDLDLLDTIYAPDAVIIHCPAPNESSSVIHRDLGGVRDRYAKFFSSNWKSLSQVDLSIVVNGNKATAESQGIVVNAEDFIKFTTKRVM